jgi:hypothetical protein
LLNAKKSGQLHGAKRTDVAIISSVNIEGFFLQAYAWSSPIEGSNKPQFLAALHTDRINSPVKGVRAAIVVEHRSRKR